MSTFHLLMRSFSGDVVPARCTCKASHLCICKRVSLRPNARAHEHVRAMTRVHVCARVRMPYHAPQRELITTQGDHRLPNCRSHLFPHLPLPACQAPPPSAVNSTRPAPDPPTRMSRHLLAPVLGCWRHARLCAGWSESCDGFPCDGFPCCWLVFLPAPERALALSPLSEKAITPGHVCDHIVRRRGATPAL